MRSGIFWTPPPEPLYLHSPVSAYADIALIFHNEGP